MPKKGAPQEASEEDLVVTLRPLFGFSPERYLPVLFAGIILILLFLLLFLPGIVNPGSRLTLVSRPSGASVYLDGTRIGATPVTRFVPQGEHELRVVKPYHAAVEEPLSIPGRLFGSLFLPRKVEHHVSLSLEDGPALVNDAARRFSGWALAGDQQGQYQFPPLLSEAVTTLYDGSPGVSAAASHARELLDRSAGDIVSPATLKDYTRAFLLQSSRASVPGPFGLARALQEAARAFEERPGLPFALSAALPESLSRQFVNNSWYDRFSEEYVTTYLPYTFESGAPGPLEEERIGGYDFVRIPGGSFVQGLARSDNPLIEPPAYQPPVLRRVPEFLMLDREVTRRLFLEFLTDRPEWTREERARLVEEGLAGPEYLSWQEDADADPAAPDAGPAGDLSVPVTHVSYPAAAAFADWFAERLPAAYAGSQVRLPREAEWEWAARVVAADGEDGVFRDSGATGPQSLGIDRSPDAAVADLLGNVWEWTSSWYHPAAYAAAPREPATSVTEAAFSGSPGDQRVVRGGSWINPSRSIDVITRGAQPPGATTPFLGFRIIIVPGPEGG